MLNYDWPSKLREPSSLRSGQVRSGRPVVSCRWSGIRKRVSGTDLPRPCRPGSGSELAYRPGWEGKTTWDRGLSVSSRLIDLSPGRQGRTICPPTVWVMVDLSMRIRNRLDDHVPGMKQVRQAVTGA